MNSLPALRSLWPKRQWQRRLLDVALVLIAILGIHYWQTRGLPEGAAPPLSGKRTDGSGVSLGVGGSLQKDAADTNRAPTLVAFWATWCPVCAAEEDNIAAVARDHHVVSVAMQSGDATAVAKHLKDRGIELPALVDADGRHAANWRVRGVPTHFVVDADGIIRFRVVGYATTWGLKARLWWAANVAA